MTSNAVTVIGGGMAGCEAALRLASRGVSVILVEAKPLWRSAAHHSDGLGEIVCSNSLKSTLPTTASGTLKNELDTLGCELLRIARSVSVPAGSALAVDRDEFSRLVTEAVNARPEITVVNKIADGIGEGITIVCAGPVCHGSLASALAQKTGEGSLSFFDAAAPIITAECVDMTRAFFGARYGKGDADYLNCPMNKDEYLAFYNALITAERAKEETGEVFEGCMPVEVMAARGEDALRYGPLRPVGFNEAGKPYAVLQLRKENALGSMYNLVGFQTNLKFGEQRRVFSMIPALKNIDIVRYGVMHRNTFVNAPAVLDPDLTLKCDKNVFVAGQLCGVEGYVESIGTGLLAAENAYRRLRGAPAAVPPTTTVLGALVTYITTPNGNFQPMNANFGILPPINGKKSERKQAYYDRSAAAIAEWAATI